MTLSCACASLTFMHGSVMTCLFFFYWETFGSGFVFQPPRLLKMCLRLSSRDELSTWRRLLRPKPTGTTARPECMTASPKYEENLGKMCHIFQTAAALRNFRAVISLFSICCVSSAVKTFENVLFLLQQYQSAIRAHKAGKAVDFDELPVPPGEIPVR